jgi:hypothetical protein
MSRRRVWVAPALAVVVLAAAAGVGATVWGGDLRYRHSLARYDGDRGEPNRYVDLDDGEAQLAIGSPDGHRIVVQWRDPDGRGWTEPETVWADEENRAIENTIRYGGGTVAIRQVYTTDVHSDSDIDSITVGIVCRELVCTAEGAPGFGGEAQVTPDGRTVYLGQSERGASFWTAEDGIHRVSWSGHPGFDYHEVSPSDPVLAPDGSLRVVTSEPSRDAGTFELLVGTPGTADLSPVARTTERLRGRAPSDCRSSLRTYSADWVELHPQDHRTRDLWFVRDGAGWTVSGDDPSGLRPADVERGCCDTSTIGFVHWNDVAFGSPDGHRILVQHHLLGEEGWSEPLLLEGATTGHRCTWQDGHEIGEHGFAVLMVCHSGEVRDEFRGDAYALAVTTDLEQWESVFVTDVRRPPEVDGDRVRVGDTTWTVDGGFVTR